MGGYTKCAGGGKLIPFSFFLHVADHGVSSRLSRARGSGFSNPKLLFSQDSKSHICLLYCLSCEKAISACYFVSRAGNPNATHYISTFKTSQYSHIHCGIANVHHLSKHGLEHID